MPKFAANISFLFTELPFLERFAAAKAEGFEGVEFLFPYEFPVDEIADARARSDITQVLFNLPAGDWGRGERGIGALPGREADFERGFREALVYADAIGCPRLHVMAGVAPTTLDPRVHLSALEGNLRRIAPVAEQRGIMLLVEPINTRSIPGYVLNRTEDALQVISNVQVSNLRLQLDLFHRQIMQGNLTHTLETHIDDIGHIQIAGVPDRHEPDVGEVGYDAIFDRLDALAYEGWVGCEYHPKTTTLAGLDWLRRRLS